MSEKVFKIISLVVMVIILLLNLIGALWTLQTTETIGVHQEPRVSVMPYTSDTPFEIESKPVAPNESIVIE